MCGTWYDHFHAGLKYFTGKHLEGDFRGLSAKSLDGRGNYALGIKEQIVFPEIDYDKVDEPRGMNVTIVTTAKTDEEGRELLSLLGMPFRRS